MSMARIPRVQRLVRKYPSGHTLTYIAYKIGKPFLLKQSIFQATFQIPSKIPMQQFTPRSQHSSHTPRSQQYPNAAPLPMQLRRLPHGHLCKIRDALVLLEEAGMGEAGMSVKDTLAAVGGHLTSKLQAADIYEESEVFRSPSHYPMNSKDATVRSKLCEALRLRKKYAYLFCEEAHDVGDVSSDSKAMVMVDGVADVPGLGLNVPHRQEFKLDLIKLWKIVKDPEVKTLSMARLERLANYFQHFDLEHSAAERAESQSGADTKDIYSVMKVDNHVHLAAAMTPRMLVEFIRKKVTSEPDREVTKGQTLIQLVSKAVGLEALDRLPSEEDQKTVELEQILAHINVDNLRTCADDHFYHRFDNFNDAYNPLGCKDLRSVFLKTSNYIDGEYFADLTKEVLKGLEENGTYAEMRLSIYGISANEWDSLAHWIKSNDLHAPEMTKRNFWMVQIPRVFSAFFNKGVVKNFEELLNNIFKPLFEVALDPSSHSDLAAVLPSITGLDCVDDESIPDPLTARRTQVYGEGKIPDDGSDILRPQIWAVGENPPYSYYSWYLAVNVRIWNNLCRKLGRPWHLTFRPHCGEAGQTHHLATAFLLADGINHGVNLEHSPSLQYLYYITQIGVAMSPLSNNALFLKIAKNPCQHFFRRGLNISLTTDDPLMFHSTTEPLLEEYVTAKHVFDFSTTDLCELAANSVRQSSFAVPGAPASRVLGLSSDWDLDPKFSNIPKRRLYYRQTQLALELQFLQFGAQPVKEILPPQMEVDWMKTPLS